MALAGIGPRAVPEPTIEKDPSMPQGMALKSGHAMQLGLRLWPHNVSSGHSRFFLEILHSAVLSDHG
jgi:hypothetical protein